MDLGMTPWVPVESCTVIGLGSHAHRHSEYPGTERHAQCPGVMHTCTVRYRGPGVMHTCTVRCPGTGSHAQ